MRTYVRTYVRTACLPAPAKAFGEGATWKADGAIARCDRS